MPVDPQLREAAATLVIVAAAHARTWHVQRRRHDRLVKQLAACGRKVDELREIVTRWSGLP